VRRLILVVAALFLASCIPVEDFGVYWERAQPDPRLPGKWRVVVPGPDPGPVPFVRIVRKGAGFEMSGEDEEGRRDPSKPSDLIRTLTVGRYQFILMRTAGQNAGLLWRYRIRANALEFTSIQSPLLIWYVETKLSGVANLKVIAEAGEAPKHIAIEVLDEAVFKALATTPDTDLYWTWAEKYERVGK
jgi:hypothetical protein